MRQQLILRARNKATKNSSPEVGEPFDQLSCIILVEFDVWEVHL